LLELEKLISDKVVGLPFLKKKEPEMMLGKGFIPVERVREMAARGFSEPEMIDILRKEGFSAEEIDRALTQALTIGVTGKSKEEPKLPKFEELIKESKPPESPVAPETSLPAEYYTLPTEEYVDYIVQARLSEVSEKINEFNVKYSELEKRIEQINEQLNEVLKTRATEQQALLSRIDSFKENIEDLNIKFSALEKAFKETLPALIESVRALSDLVQKLRKEA
jgi:DNA-binding transcriptional MerR regulator